MEKIQVLDVEFSNVTLSESVDIAINNINENKKTMVVTPNSEIVHICTQNKEFLKIINSADLVLPDGIGVIYASKILKTPLKEKVAGIEFAEQLVKRMAEKGQSLYILGAKPNIAKLASENLAEKYKGLKIAGYCDGYFKDESQVIENINKSKANVVFVCLGAIKQEKFMSDNLDKLNVQIMCGIGGSADVFSGQIKRAPKIFVQLGLEWFYRLLLQPSRIGRMSKIPLFLIKVMGEGRRK